MRGLYGDVQGEHVSAQLARLLEKYKDVARTNSEATRLSQKDVLLITYGDALVDDEVAPLRVLQHFHSDYLQGIFELVHILPFHPYTSDDGFSVVDYLAIRDDLGDWSDIESLAKDCRLMADAVINHMSSESGWFAKFLGGDPDFTEFFVECDADDDLTTVVRPRTTPLRTRFEGAEGQSRLIWTTFSADQVDLNYHNPNVLIAVIDVLFFLISKGVRLLRLDAVTFLWKEPGTSSVNLPETHALIKILRYAISMLRDDVVVITETNVPHRENVAYFGDGHDEAHMVYNFALPPLLAYSFVVGDGTRLSHWASQLSTPSSDVCFLNFSASHDGVGVRPVEEILTDGELQVLVDASISAKGLVSSRTLADGEEHPYELNCTFLDLISRDSDDVTLAVARFVASQAIVLAMPGVPAIYIQSLLGTHNDLEQVAETGRARSINRSQHEYAAVVANLRDDNCLESRVFSAITELIKIRRQHLAFDPYAPSQVLNLGQQIFALRRGAAGRGGTVSCIVNLAAENVVIDIDTDAAGVDLLSGSKVVAGRHELSPYAIYWLTREKN